jgi:DNA-binding MarR family transcriptional regulator
MGRAVRLTYEALRARVVKALHEHGFTDITESDLGVFYSSGPERARPIDLAQRCHMTKQAMNYVLSKMRESGYLERRSDGDSDHRLVHLTPRGWNILDVIRQTIDAVEGEWRKKVGRQRFESYLEVMEEIILAEARTHKSNAPGAVIQLRRRRPQKPAARRPRRA